MQVRINLLTLTAAVALWAVVFPKPRNRFLEVLKQVPAFREFQNRFMRDAVVESFKIAGIYWTLQRVGVK